MGLFRRRPKLDVGYCDVPDSDACKFKIVGESFYTRQIAAVLKDGKRHIKSPGGWTKLGVQFWLVRDIHNEHDKNAISVCASATDSYDHKTALQVGHLDRETAAMHASDVVQPVPVKGTIVGKERHFGIKLDEADMAAGGLISKTVRVDIDERVAMALVPRGRNREDEWDIIKTFSATLRHSPRAGDDPNTIEVVIDKGGKVVGVVDPTDKLWGPYVDGLEVKLTLERSCYERYGDEDDLEDDLWGHVRAKLPSNAHEASTWECSPYCAKISQADLGHHQAVGRLLHTRFKIATCDAAKEAFREAKRLNAALKAETVQQ